MLDTPTDKWKEKFPVLCAFAKLQKANISAVMPVCLSGCLFFRME
jgi:hypothetical protein